MENSWCFMFHCYSITILHIWLTGPKQSNSIWFLLPLLLCNLPIHGKSNQLSGFLVSTLNFCTIYQASLDWFFAFQRLKTDGWIITWCGSVRWYDRLLALLWISIILIWDNFVQNMWISLKYLLTFNASSIQMDLNNYFPHFREQIKYHRAAVNGQ